MAVAASCELRVASCRLPRSPEAVGSGFLSRDRKGIVCSVESLDKRPRQRAEAVTLLAALQRSGRFICRITRGTYVGSHIHSSHPTGNPGSDDPSGRRRRAASDERTP